MFIDPNSGSVAAPSNTHGDENNTTKISTAQGMTVKCVKNEATTSDFFSEAATHAAPTGAPVRPAISAAPIAATGTEVSLKSPVGTVFNGISAVPSRAEQLHQHLNAALLKSFEKDLRSASGKFALCANLADMAVQSQTELSREIIRMEHKFKTTFVGDYGTAMNAKNVNECAQPDSRSYIDTAKSVIEDMFATSKKTLQDLKKLQSDPTTRSASNAMMNDSGFDYNFEVYVKNISENSLAFATLDKFNVHQEEKKFVAFDAKNGMSFNNLLRLQQSQPYKKMKASIVGHAKTFIAGLKKENFSKVRSNTEFVRETGTFFAQWEKTFDKKFDAAVGYHAPQFSDLTAFLDKVATTTMTAVGQRFDAHGNGTNGTAVDAMLMNLKLEDNLANKLQALGATFSQPKNVALEAAPSSVATGSVKIVEITDSPDMPAAPQTGVQVAVPVVASAAASVAAPVDVSVALPVDAPVVVPATASSQPQPPAAIALTLAIESLAQRPPAALPTFEMPSVPGVAPKKPPRTFAYDAGLAAEAASKMMRTTQETVAVGPALVTEPIATEPTVVAKPVIVDIPAESTQKKSKRATGLRRIRQFANRTARWIRVKSHELAHSVYTKIRGKSAEVERVFLNPDLVTNPLYAPRAAKIETKPAGVENIRNVSLPHDQNKV